MRRAFHDVRGLFFHENNGFIFGMIGCFVGFSLGGRLFLLVGVPVLALACYLLNRSCRHSIAAASTAPIRPDHQASDFVA